MPEPSWKRLERRVAYDFGTRRTPLSGSRSGHSTRSDTLHPELFIECRQRVREAVITEFAEVRRLAHREGREPMLVKHEKRAKKKLVVLDYDFLLRLWHNQRNIVEQNCCALCGREADGPMFVIAGLHAHALCVKRELEQLLDPEV